MCSKYPCEKLSKSVLNEIAIKQIGLELLDIDNNEIVEYKKGVLIIRKRFKRFVCRKNRKSANFKYVYDGVERDCKNFNCDCNQQKIKSMGGVIELSHLIVSSREEKLKTKQRLLGWPCRNHHRQKGKEDYYFHRGHIIGHELAVNSDLFLSDSITHAKNLFTQTAWSNCASQQGNAYGYTLEYFEHEIAECLRKVHSLKIIYQVKLIDGNGEVIPRGVHLKAIFMGQNKQLNVFIPNVDPRFIVDYTGKSLTSTVE